MAHYPAPPDHHSREVRAQLLEEWAARIDAEELRRADTEALRAIVPDEWALSRSKTEYY